MAQIVLWHAPDMDNDRTVARVPKHWPTGRRLCVVSDLSTKNFITVIETGTLMSCRIRVEDIDRYGIETDVKHRSMALRLKRRLRLLSGVVKLSETRVNQAIAELSQ